MDYAQLLNHQLYAIEEKQREVAAEVELPVPELGEDFVFRFRARRVDLSQMMFSGQIPENLALTLISALPTDKNGQTVGDKIDKEKVVKALSPLDQYKTVEFQRKIAMGVCADPRIVESWDPGPGEVSLYRLPTELIQALYLYGLQLSPAVPVKTTEGKEVSVSEIENFPAGERVQ